MDCAAIAIEQRSLEVAGRTSTHSWQHAGNQHRLKGLPTCRLGIRPGFHHQKGSVAALNFKSKSKCATFNPRAALTDPSTVRIGQRAVTACASILSPEIANQTSPSEQSRASQNGASAAAVPFIIEAEEVARQLAESNLSEEAFLTRLVHPTLPLARPEMSNFRVGAVGLGVSGRIFRGVNLEFPGLPLQQSIHAEQFMITNAMLHEERALKTIAVSAAPCGHCRQFMCELPNSGKLKILIVDSQAEESTLEQLLPHRFGPHDLKEDAFPLLLAERHNRLVLADGVTNGELERVALEAANWSYAPYLDCPSGLAIRTVGGQVYSGSYIESAAHNPSMSPLHSALVAAVAQGGESFIDIREAVLVERRGAQTEHADIMKISLRKIAPKATFRVAPARRPE